MNPPLKIITPPPPDNKTQWGYRGWRALEMLADIILALITLLWMLVNAIVGLFGGGGKH